MVSPEEHHAVAERLLDVASKGYSNTNQAEVLLEALVHAVLAGAPRVTTFPTNVEHKAE